MATTHRFGELGLSILGVGSQYPPYALKTDAVDTLSKRFYPDSPAMQKVLAINRFTGIDTRSSIGTPEHPLVNQPSTPSIADLHRVFVSDGHPLAVSAARAALMEARVEASALTHMVSTTCTDSANPGYDHFVSKELGCSPNLERVLLHGIGCSGGLAALRTAANLCLGHAMRGLPARVLVLALEVSTIMVRSELDSVNASQEIRIGLALFSDCASAVVLSNGIGEETAPPVYELLGWEHRTIPDTEADLGFDVDPAGWKVVLTPRVPELAQAAIMPAYEALRAALPAMSLPAGYSKPGDFDWAMHPGGATILSKAERAIGIAPEHMRASYDTYINHGNSSSATIFSVLDRLRSKDMDQLTPGGRGPREYVMGCAFGPGITVEMCMLKRNLGHGGGSAAGLAMATGLQTPPESEVSSRSDDGDDLPPAGDDIVTPAPAQANTGDGQIQKGTGVENVSQSDQLKDKDDDDAYISEALESVELD